MFTTGDKLLNVMKEEEISIMELSRMSGVPERTIMDILAGIREPELGVVCRIADGLGICVHELRADEEQYAISVQKDTLAKLIVVSEINGVELEELIHTILESSIMLISSSFITFNNLSPVVNILFPPLFFLPARRFLFRKLHDKLKLYPAFFCPVFGVMVFFRPTRNDVGIIRLACFAL